MIEHLRSWIERHPAKAGALAGWYQQAASGIVTLAIIPLFKNRLSPDNAGVWFSFQNLILIVSLADFGIGFSVARQVAFSFAAKGREAQGDLISTQPGWAGISELYAAIRSIFARLVIVELFALVLLHEAILPLGRLGQQRTASSTLAWYLLGGAAMAMTRTRQYHALFEGLGKMYISRFLAGTQQLVSGIAAIVGILIVPNLLAAAAGVMLVSALYLLLMRHLLQRESQGRLEYVRRPPAGLTRSLFRAAVPMGVVNSSSYLVSAIQVPLIGSILGPALVTPFYAAQKIGQMLNVAVMQMTTPHLPLFTQDLAAHKFRQAAARMSKTVRIGSIAAVGVNLLFFAASPIFARWWLGRASYIDQTTLLIMSIGYVCMSCSVLCVQFVLASGRNPFTYTSVLAGIFNLVGCFVLAPRFGIAGIAASGLLAGLATNYWYAPRRGVHLFNTLKSQSR